MESVANNILHDRVATININLKGAFYVWILPILWGVMSALCLRLYLQQLIPLGLGPTQKLVITENKLSGV